MNVQLVADNSAFMNQVNPGNKTMVVCNTSDLIENSGICALVEDQQVAIFYIPNSEKKIFAVSNWDPIGKANVISRGIVGDIKGTLVVASPLYKQHFNLQTGACIEDSTEKLTTFKVEIVDDKVIIS